MRRVILWKFWMSNPMTDQTTFAMADVADKPKTRRKAIAAGRIALGPEAFAPVVERRLPKGDALVLAEVAAILGAKKTPELIPLCHPINLNRVRVQFVPQPLTHSIEAFCLVEIAERTGVEMEALTAVSIALLTIWDLAKPIEAALAIDAVRLLYKEGGKSGVFEHPDGLPAAARTLLEA